MALAISEGDKSINFVMSSIMFPNAFKFFMSPFTAKASASTITAGLVGNKPLSSIPWKAAKASNKGEETMKKELRF